jgi:uncharacterized protein (DUF1330 family)
MKNYLALAAAMLAGAAFGAIAVGTLHAQGAAKAYAFVDISEITNPDLFKTLIPKAGPAVQAFGGKFIVRTDKITAGEGQPPKRFVVIEFDSLDKIKAWHDSAAQKEVDEILMKASKSRSFSAPGL